MTIVLPAFIASVFAVIAFALPALVALAAVLLSKRKQSELQTLILAIAWVAAVAVYVATIFALPWSAQGGIFFAAPALFVSIGHVAVAITVASRLYETHRLQQPDMSNVTTFEEVRRTGTK